MMMMMIRFRLFDRIPPEFERRMSRDDNLRVESTLFDRFNMIHSTSTQFISTFVVVVVVVLLNN